MTVDFRKHSGPTPADDMAAQIITDCGNNTGLQATWILCLSSLPPDSRTLISKWNAKCTLIWIDDFGPLSNSPVLFSLAQVRCFWWCFCFRSGLVALFLKMSERVTLEALTSASVHSLWSSPKCLNRFCFTVFSSFRSSLLLLHIFLPNFFLPVNFAFNMIWYSTLWTPFSNDPLWLTLSVEGVNVHLLDHC